MATDVGIGDIEIPRLVIDPADDDTEATLVVTAPDGEPATLTTAMEDEDEEAGTQTWAADPVTYDQPGRWVLTWTVTGTGAGTEEQVVQVVTSPVVGGPLWTPGRSRVANYVPGRTLARDVEGLQNTFDSTTTPNGVQVDRLIYDAVGWVVLRTGAVDESLHEQAATCAAIWAAAAVELGFPDNPDDDNNRRTAQDLRGMAERMREDLKRANDAIVGTNPTDPAAALLPRYNFPVPGTDVLDWNDSYV